MKFYFNLGCQPGLIVFCLFCTFRKIRFRLSPPSFSLLILLITALSSKRKKRSNVVFALTGLSLRCVSDLFYFVIYYCPILQIVQQQPLYKIELTLYHIPYHEMQHMNILIRAYYNTKIGHCAE